MDGGHRALPQKMRQRQHHAGPQGVVVDHIVPAEQGVQGGQKRIDHRVQAFFVDGGHRDNPRPGVLAAFGGALCGPVVQGNGVAHGGQLNRQLFHHHFHAALPAGHPLVADHGDVHEQVSFYRVTSSALRE